MNYAGELFRLGMMFVRELLVKSVLFGFFYPLTFVILFLLDNLRPLWGKDNQALHDKIVGSFMFYVPRS